MPSNDESTPQAAPSQGLQEQATGTTEAPISASSEAVLPATGRLGAFGKLGREIQEADLAHPGVQKLLLDLLNQAEAECAGLRPLVEKYHEADKERAVLLAKTSTGTAFEILCNGAFAVGGVLIGVAPTISEDHHVTFVVVSGLGWALMILSSAARFTQRRR